MVTAEQLLIQAAELKKKKSEDYQGSTWTEADYFPYKEKSYSHMLHTKYLRMRNIVDGNQKTNFEALDDTLIDMAVYACMFAAYLKNNNGVKMTDENKVVETPPTQKEVVKAPKTEMSLGIDDMLKDAKNLKHYRQGCRYFANLSFYKDFRDQLIEKDIGTFLLKAIDG